MQRAKPTSAASAAAPKNGVLGLLVCLSCWEPLAFRAIHDTFPRLSKAEVAAEIKARYSLTMQQLQVLNGRKHADLLGLHSRPIERGQADPQEASSSGAPAKAGPKGASICCCSSAARLNKSAPPRTPCRHRGSCEGGAARATR